MAWKLEYPTRAAIYVTNNFLPVGKGFQSSSGQSSQSGSQKREQGAEHLPKTFWGMDWGEK